jgi:hypothetical protein
MRTASEAAPHAPHAKVIIQHKLQIHNSSAKCANHVRLWWVAWLVARHRLSPELQELQSAGDRIYVMRQTELELYLRAILFRGKSYHVIVNTVQYTYTAIRSTER